MEIPFDELMAEYARRKYQQFGSYSEAARRLDVDWRTLKKYAQMNVPKDYSLC